MEPKKQVKQENKPKEQDWKKRDFLLDMQNEAQQMWKDSKIFECEPKQLENKRKWMSTFPFPYMNGALHFGHAYTLTKAEFTARFKRLTGHNSLFPFGFHCTGMPIMASADKLKRQFKQYEEDKDESFKYNKGQYLTLRKCDVDESEIVKFQDPRYWCKYFPAKAKEDLLQFGAAIDWRRSFITTDQNPYYDSFIRWQFQKLKYMGVIQFGKRPAIFDTVNKQPCADHGRASGEGEGPQEQTLIKMEVLEFESESLKTLKEQVGDRKVYLVAATLRPETMYGQTNCFVLPKAVYGAYEMKNDEVFVTSAYSIRNMAYQNLTKVEYEISKLCDVPGTDLVGCPLKAPLTSYERVYAIPMTTISMEKGTGIVTSVPSDAPDDWACLRDFQTKEKLRKKYGVKMEWVESFAPIPIIEIPGYSTLSALKACDFYKVKSHKDVVKLKKAKKEVYLDGFYKGVFITGLCKGEKVETAKPKIRKMLIENNEAAVYWEPENKVVSRSGDVCVVTFCDQWFFTYGSEEWKKPVIEYVKNGGFVAYNSQTKNEFINALEWISDWGCSRDYGLGTKLPWDEKFLIESLSDSTIYMAYYTVAHYMQGDIYGSTPGSMNIKPEQMTEACWDYIFQETEYNSWNMKVSEEKLAECRKSFQYWYPMDLRVSGKDLIRNHLIFSLLNHRAVWHKKGVDMLPRTYFCNGHIQVNNEKMSKSLGNFKTSKQVIGLYGADASRLTLADSGDNLDDANFVMKNAENNILKIYELIDWITKTLEKVDELRTGVSEDTHLAFVDKLFEANVLQIVYETFQCYQSMRYRDVVKMCEAGLRHIMNEYKIHTQNNFRRDLIVTFIEYQLTVLYPICPHFTEIVWKNQFKKVKGTEDFADLLSNHRWREVKKSDIDFQILDSYAYIQKVKKNMRHVIKKTKGKKKKGKKGKNQQPQTKVGFTNCTVVVTNKYADWQIGVLAVINPDGVSVEEKEVGLKTWRKAFVGKGKDKKFMQQQLKFGNYIVKNIKMEGWRAANQSLSFDEKAVLENSSKEFMQEFKLEQFNVINVEDFENMEMDKKEKASILRSVNVGNPNFKFA